MFKGSLTYPQDRYAVTRMWPICNMGNLLHGIAIGENIPL